MLFNGFKRFFCQSLVFGSTSESNALLLRKTGSVLRNRATSHLDFHKQHGLKRKKHLKANSTVSASSNSSSNHSHDVNSSSIKHSTDANSSSIKHSTDANTSKHSADFSISANESEYKPFGEVPLPTREERFEEKGGYGSTARRASPLMKKWGKGISRKWVEATKAYEASNNTEFKKQLVMDGLYRVGSFPQNKTMKKSLKEKVTGWFKQKWNPNQNDPTEDGGFTVSRHSSVAVDGLQVVTPQDNDMVGVCSNHILGNYMADGNEINRRNEWGTNDKGTLLKVCGCRYRVIAFPKRDCGQALEESLGFEGQNMGHYEGAGVASLGFCGCDSDVHCDTIQRTGVQSFIIERCFN